MSEILGPDPRLLPLEIVGFDVPVDRGLPCEQVTCTPLEDACLEQGTDRSQAVLSCARFMAASGLATQNRELANELTAHGQLIQRLSVDQKTGILTLNANDALFDRLRTTGLLDRLRTEGYIMQFTFGDIDKLKEHNALGDHYGGDLAIEAAAQTLKQLYRRNYDVVGVLEYEQEAWAALEDTAAFNAVSRFAAGDELIVMSFLPPTDERRSRMMTPDDLQREVGRITRAFRDLFVEYPLKRGVQVGAMHARLSQQGFIFSLTPDGNVHAPVSMTFATVLAEIPTSQAEYEGIKLSADATMMVSKRQRHAVATRGAFAYLLSTDSREAGA